MVTIEQLLKEGCDVLLHAASPDIYHINAFRISGLNVSATTREISNQVQKNQMIEKYGMKMDNHKSPFPIDPPPDIDKLRQALHRLRDPETRIIDEFFWFWPHSIDCEITDHALEALARKDIVTAESLWINYEATLTESNVSRHNLAVLSHLLALDIELNGKELTKDKIAFRDKCWKDTFKRWALLIEHEGFWSRLTARVKQMDDPRLTTGFVKRMRDSLPYALLIINASLALKAAEAGNKPEANRQLNLMNKSEFGRQVVNYSLKHVANPLRNRIKIICKSFSDYTYPDKKSELDACKKLLTQTKELLSAIDILFQESNTIKEGAHDEVALAATGLAISYANETKDWESVLPIFEEIRKIVFGESAKARVETNYDIFKRNVEFDRLHNTCFFCQKNRGSEKFKIKVSMHGNVRQVEVINIGGREIELPYSGGYSIHPVYTRWNYNTFEVPRCEDCANIHNKKFSWTGTFLGFAIGIAALTIFQGKLGAAVIIVSVVIGFIYDIITNNNTKSSNTSNIKPYSQYKNFPAINEKLKEGWTWGERPADN